MFCGSRIFKFRRLFCSSNFLISDSCLRRLTTSTCKSSCFLATPTTCSLRSALSPSTWVSQLFRARFSDSSFRILSFWSSSNFRMSAISSFGDFMSLARLNCMHTTGRKPNSTIKTIVVSLNIVH